MPTEFTQKGYIELWQNGALVSRHTREREAVEKALALAEPLETEVTFEIKFPSVIMKKSPHVKNPNPGQPGDTTPPATPSGFQATPTGASTVSLTWTANTDDTVSYIIRRSLTSNIAADGADIVTKSGIASNSHTDSGLTPGTLYYYNIRAADLAGNNSPVSATDTALTSASGTSPEYVGDDNYYPGQNTFFDLRMSYVWRDAESNPITYSVVSGSLPTGLVFNQSPARIDGVPTVLGQSTSVVIQASDGLSAPTQKTLNFTVQTNASPVWTIGNNYAFPAVDNTTGTTIDFDNYAVDFEADPLIFTLISQSKGGVAGDYGITLDSQSGVLTVPTGLAADTYSVRVRLSDTSTAEADWLARSTAAGVLRAIRFDNSTEVTANTLADVRAGNVTYLTTDAASGAGCLRFAVNDTDGQNNGNWRLYIASDQRVFGPAQSSKKYFVQFRQKAPANFMHAAYPGTNGGYANGQKHIICSWFAASNQNNEVVIEDSLQMGAPTWYYQNGSSFANDRISMAGGAFFRMQTGVDNGTPASPVTIADYMARYGLTLDYNNSNRNTGTPDTNNGGFYYTPDEWMTFELMVDFTNGFNAANVQIWVAHASAAPVRIVNSTVTLGSANGGHNAIWLLPYCTNRTSNGGYDTYTLYDEVITSTSPINFPGGFVVTP